MRLLRSAVVTASIPLALLSGGVAALAGAAEGDKSPKQILADVQRDLSKVKSFHFVANVKEKGSTTRMAGDIFASGSASITISERRGSVRMIQLPRQLYMNATADYWKAVGGKDGKMLAKALAGRWVKVPASAGADLKPLVAKFSPKYLASCIAVDGGTIVNNGIKTVAGQEAIELEYKGEQPGTSPGLLYITAEGPVLPVRTRQTGPRKPGGKINKRCDGDDAGSTSGEVTFSRFDAVARIKAPRGALSLEDNGTTA
jgi:hypothetical protein